MSPREKSRRASTKSGPPSAAPTSATCAPIHRRTASRNRGGAATPHAAAPVAFSRSSSAPLSRSNSAPFSRSNSAASAAATAPASHGSPPACAAAASTRNRARMWWSHAGR
eukprot:scaffold9328_cov84-Isochrysis_galbana.AAC.2